MPELFPWPFSEALNSAKDDSSIGFSDSSNRHSELSAVPGLRFSTKTSERLTSS